jgi:hypothetical protein
VVGDPARVAPPQVDEEGNRGQDPGGMGVSSAVGGGETALLDDRVVAFPSQHPATLWIDMEGFDVRRMRLDDGVRVLFGPYVMFERVRVPSWLQVEEERGSVRFEVVDVTPVNAPASAFDEDWLLAPSTTPPSPDQFPAGSPDAPERSRR